MAERLKKYNTIGCCGIDCGLCPRFHATGVSTCPGCCGNNFKDKHPSCGVVTCCVNKRNFETCADCSDFPCYRFKTESSGYDSFVTHRKIYPNLDNIKTNGIALFISQQQVRIDILIDFLQNGDDGRSKSFYCISCALLPIDKLQDAHGYMVSLGNSIDIKEKSKRLKDYIQVIANDLMIDLKLNNKK
jgi:hypothetical protein